MKSSTESPSLGRDQLARALREHFESAVAIRQQAAADPILGQRRDQLRQWQSRRLSRSYADLLASPRFAPAANFFLSDIYSVQDLSARDEAFQRALPSLSKLLPHQALVAMNSAMAADALSERLDAELATRLFGNVSGNAAGSTKRKVPAEITLPQYAKAFREADNRPERDRQLALVLETGRILDGIAGSRLLYTAIQMMRGPARASGLIELHAFLERGMSAFKALGGATEFLEILERRETAVMDGLFSGAPDPFSWPDPAS